MRGRSRGRIRQQGYLRSWARLRKRTFLFFLPPPSILSMWVDSDDTMAVRFLNISFMEGSSSPDVQSDSWSEGAVGVTVFFMALPFLEDFVVALFFGGFF